MPTPKKSTFSETTLIPVSLLITIAGVVFWIGSLAARLEAAEQSIEKAQSREAAMYAELAQLHAQVVGIDQKVTTILDLMQREHRQDR